MSTFDLIDHSIERYCEEHTIPETDVLYQLNRKTHLETINPRMLSGHLQGTFLTFVTKMMQPQRVLEIGTFTGYSAICLAQGMPPTGILHTIECNVEYEDRITKALNAADSACQIIVHYKDAKALLPTLSESWDLVFVDADKEDYQTYYDLVLPQVRKGGFLLIDNVLWNGKVTREVAHNDRDTQAILAFNDFVQHDVRVRNLLLPFRDGIMMIEKL